MTAPDPIASLVAGVLERRPRAVARALSAVEDGGEPQRQLVRRIYERTGRARVVGVTGPPGAGKSTLVDRLARLLRSRGETVGILAVDPTSPFTGGALLGDRIRMQALYTDPGVFIRSMATRGAIGGLAPATRDAVDVLDAAGFDWVLVETVGVGQDEVDVVRSVDTVVLVTLPGLGDEIQAIKAGIMEIADVFVINKADREGAERTARELKLALELDAPGRGWLPPIVRTVASTGRGVEEVAEAVARHRAHLEASGELAERRRVQLRLRVEMILKERVLAAADRRLGLEREVERAAAERLDPYTVADTVFERMTQLSAGVVKEGGQRQSVGVEQRTIQGIEHVGVAVRSIAEARPLYEALGLAVAAIEEVPQEGVRVALIPCGASRIELLEPTTPDSPVAKFLARRGPGLHHLCLATDDVRAADRRLRSGGFAPLRAAPTRGAGGCWVQFVHPRSAGGVLLEIAQSAEGEEP